MSEVKVYTLEIGYVEKVSVHGTDTGVEQHEVVMKSDYDKIKEKLTTFDGMTFSENQEIAKLKQAVEKLVRMYGKTDHWEEDNGGGFSKFCGDENDTDISQEQFKRNVSGKLAREIAKELGIEIV